MNSPHSQAFNSPTTVLLVEDELIIRMNVAEYLCERGFLIFEASNAAEAIDLLSSSTRRIDLVFTDVRMPGKMDGLALACWLQAHRAGLPVIVTSGDVVREDAAMNGAPGAFFFSKPYELSTVAEAIFELTRPAAA